MQSGSQGTRAIAIAVAGVAGSGKTTLGGRLARCTGLPLLDLDAITNPLLDRIGALGSDGHWLASVHAQTVRDGRYAALRAVARDVVATAGGAVLVAPFTAELRGGREWTELRDAVDPAEIRVVRLVGEDDLFDLRRTARGAPRDRHRRTHRAGSPPAIPVIAVDADLTTDQQVVRVNIGLGRRTSVDPTNGLFSSDFDAVLFDLDGSLVDSTASVIRSWRRFAAEMGVPMQALHDNHGQPARTLVEKLLPPGRTEAGLARITAIEVADALGVRPTIGASRLFESVPANRRAIVTSGSLPIAAARLAAAGIPRPRVLVTSDDVDRGKPDPAPFRLAARRLGIAPERCLAVEDAAAGIRSARAAGCQVLAVMGTEAVEELSEAALVVDGLDRIAVRIDDGVLRLRPSTEPVG